MARLRKKHLPHRVELQHLAGEGAEGETWSGWIPDVPAYVEQKTRLVVDRRSSSPTVGQEITSTTLIVLLPDQQAAPRTRVKVWGGTPRERTSEVIDAAFLSYNDRTPNHWELYAE